MLGLPSENDRVAFTSEGVMGSCLSSGRFRAGAASTRRRRAAGPALRCTSGGVELALRLLAASSRSSRSLSARSIRACRPVGLRARQRRLVAAKKRSTNRSFSSRPRGSASAGSSASGSVRRSAHVIVRLTRHRSDGAADHHFLDLADRLGRVQALRADIDAVHDACGSGTGGTGLRGCPGAPAVSWSRLSAMKR